MSDELPVYRKVDGELVPIPGNKRDPNRRYSLVMDMKMGNYHCEFTDEEERERDAEEAKWEAERPLRDAEAKRQQEEFEKLRSSLEYEDRIFAFIDICGWKNAIKKSEIDDNLARALGLALHSLKINSEFTNNISKIFNKCTNDYKPQMTNFSDSVVVSVVNNEYGEDNLLFHINSFVRHLTSMEFFVRGAVTSGKIVHKPGIVYGPALITAYEMERDIARYPRIILDHKLGELWGKGTPVYDKNHILIGHKRNWRLDSDGYYYLDHLQPFINTPGTNIDPHLMRSTMNAMHLMLKNRPPEAEADPKTLEKYIWLENYYNSICDEYSSLNIPKVSRNGEGT